VTRFQYQILLFEDDIDLVMQWTAAFKEKNIKVVHSSSVDGIIEACKQVRYDAIVSDLFIREGMSDNQQGGVILLHQLEASRNSRMGCLSYNATVPRIVVTGCSGLVAHTLKKLTDRLNSRLFLTKPFTPELLVDRVIQQIEEFHNK
jgi:DNA-binding response OmpR family regulator